MPDGAEQILKGWIQTWRVHTRQPLRLARELGPLGAAAFQLFLACNVLAALVHPIFLAALCYSLVARPPLQAIGALVWNAPEFATVLVAGYVSTIWLDLIGLHRRGLLKHAWALVLTPLYWLLLSFAAWRALLQLLSDPHRWEKTEHGLAKNSRLAKSQRPKCAVGKNGQDRSADAGSPDAAHRSRSRRGCGARDDYGGDSSRVARIAAHVALSPGRHAASPRSISQK